MKHLNILNKINYIVHIIHNYIEMINFQHHIKKISDINILIVVIWTNTITPFNYCFLGVT